MTTVKLDPGDLGLEYIPGVGFRPLDGIQTYGGGKYDTPDCPIARTWKNMATDRVHADRECQQPDAPPVVAEVSAPPVPAIYAGISTGGGYYTQTPYWPTGGGYVPFGIPYYPVIPLPPETPCCTGITVVPPPPPEIPPVPILGSSGALLTALLALVCVRAAGHKLGLSTAQLGHILNSHPRTVRRWESDDDPRPVNPIAARVIQWMLDGYRPPEWE